MHADTDTLYSLHSIQDKCSNSVAYTTGIATVVLAVAAVVGCKQLAVCSAV
jgi:hypothetical protein